MQGQARAEAVADEIVQRGDQLGGWSLIRFSLQNAGSQSLAPLRRTWMAEC